MLDRRKHHHLRTFKQSSAIGGSSVGDDLQLQHCTHSAAISVPRGASIFASHALISPKQRHIFRTLALLHSRPRFASENHGAQSIRPDPMDRATVTLRRPKSCSRANAHSPSQTQICRKNLYLCNFFSFFFLRQFFSLSKNPSKQTREITIGEYIRLLLPDISVCNFNKH